MCYTVKCFVQNVSQRRCGCTKQKIISCNIPCDRKNVAKQLAEAIEGLGNCVLLPVSVFHMFSVLHSVTPLLATLPSDFHHLVTHCIYTCVHVPQVFAVNVAWWTLVPCFRFPLSLPLPLPFPFPFIETTWVVNRKIFIRLSWRSQFLND